MGNKSKCQALPPVTWIEVLSLGFFVRRERLHLARGLDKRSKRDGGCESAQFALLSNYSIKNKTSEIRR